jgi:hypothetical protein
VAWLGAAWLVVACASTVAPEASPTWLAARVEQPAAIEAAPSNAPAFCSPCHPIVGTYIDSVVAFHGGYLALGQDLPPSHAAAWSSTDPSSWHRVTSLPAPEGSGIAAAVTDRSGAVLAVGESGGAAAVWRSTDGVAWTLTTLPEPGAGATEWLTSVAESSDGFVAAGYEQSATAQREAAFWRSADGSSWVRATTQTPVAAGEVTGMAALPSGKLIAVGITGDERTGTAAVWQSTDGGSTWQAFSSPTFATGRMLAVVAAGGGVVAVGERQDQTGAAAWYSADGENWVSASGSGLDNGGLQLVMTAVASDGSGFVAAGWRTDAGNGSAVVWRSTDGKVWIHVPQDVSFSGAGLAAVLGSPRLLVGGTMGWPDTHSAQVWIAPAG